MQLTNNNNITTLRAVDLLRPTVSGGNILSGAMEKEGNKMILPLSNLTVMGWSRPVADSGTLAISTQTLVTIGTL